MLRGGTTGSSQVLGLDDPVWVECYLLLGSRRRRSVGHGPPLCPVQPMDSP